MKRIILIMIAVFIVSMSTAKAQLDRVSIDTSSTIKKLVKVRTFKGSKRKYFCVPLLYIDQKLFEGNKAELLGLIGGSLPQINNDSYILIKHAGNTGIYERQKLGYWEQLTATTEIVSEVKIVGKDIFVTLSNLPVKNYKLTRVINENFLQNVPFVPHWYLISHW